MSQLRFAGPAFRLPRSEHTGSDQRAPEERRKAAERKAAAHLAVEAAERELIIEEGRPACREHWVRMAICYQRRAEAWRQLAEQCRPDPYGHSSRAMGLAADWDAARARMVRERLGVAG